MKLLKTLEDGMTSHIHDSEQSILFNGHISKSDTQSQCNLKIHMETQKLWVLKVILRKGSMLEVSQYLISNHTTEP
jgi:hypothetical protein